MPAIVLDTSLCPLVLSSMPSRFTADDVDAYFAAFRSLHDRDQAFVLVNNLSKVDHASTTAMRHKASAFMKDEEERSRRLCRGSVQVTTSRLARGALIALHWMSPPPYPHTVVATAEEGVDWAAARAEEARLVVDVAAGRELAEHLFVA